MLGPLEVRDDDGSPVAVGRGRQRVVLARLLVDAGRVVSAARLIDDVWGGSPPPTAAKVLQKHVSELRRALPAPVIRTVGQGYVADVEDDAIDARRFERLVAGRRFSAALELWRGDVLADLDDIDDLAFVAPERARLEELRVLAVEGRLEQELAAGRHSAIVAELSDLVDHYPLRERLVGLYMLALYRSGRQVEALRAFDHHRRHLADEVGVDPAADLRSLEGAILRHDPELDPAVDDDDSRVEPAGNLALALTSFVGRTAELDAARNALASHRLVTFTGPAGVGKTRFALELAGVVSERYPGGVWVVDLAPVVDPELVSFTIASVLGVDTRHAADELTAIAGALSRRPPSLLVLDNCEHLVEPCARITGAVLRGARGVRVLATSRRPLGVDAEFVRPVAPLPTPDAAVLLVDRARLVGADAGLDDELAQDICRQLDGLPLAVELAAGQLRVLTANELAERVHQHLSFHPAASTASRPQRTLGDMVRASYEVLPAAVGRTFACLGVFSSSFTLAAAEAVCTDGGTPAPDVLGHLATLLDNSLLVRDPLPGPTSRYRLLETLRLFALDRLAEAGCEQRARRAHATFYCALAEAAGRRLYGPDERGQRRTMALEEPNLHDAARWSLAHEQTLAFRMVVGLWPYWDARWAERHAVAYIAGLLGQGELDDEQLAWMLTVAADLAANGGDANRAIPWATEAVTTFRDVGDNDGLGRALLALGSALGNRGALDAADAALDEAVRLLERRDEPVLVARALDRQSFVATRRGDHRRAEQLSRAELAAWAAAGSDWGEATAMRHAAVALQHLGELDAALDLCRRALGLWHPVEDRAAIAHVQLTHGDIARARGDLDDAAGLYRRALAEFQAIEDVRCTASTYKNLAAVAAASGQVGEAAELVTLAVRLRHQLGDEAGLAECFELRADVETATADYVEATAMLAAAEGVRHRTGSAPTPGETAAIAALLDDARRHLGEQSFARAYALGAAWSPAEAVGHVLDTA